MQGGGIATIVLRVGLDYESRTIASSAMRHIASSCMSYTMAFSVASGVLYHSTATFLNSSMCFVTFLPSAKT